MPLFLITSYHFFGCLVLPFAFQTYCGGIRFLVFALGFLFRVELGFTDMRICGGDPISAIPKVPGGTKCAELQQEV